MKNPPPIGGFVETEIIEPLGFPVTRAAKIVGVTRAASSNERSSLSPETVNRMAKAVGSTMETLIRKQDNYDIAQVRMPLAPIDAARYVADFGAAE